MPTPGIVEIPVAAAYITQVDAADQRFTISANKSYTEAETVYNYAFSKSINTWSFILAGAVAILDTLAYALYGVDTFSQR